MLNKQVNEMCTEDSLTRFSQLAWPHNQQAYGQINYKCNLPTLQKILEMLSVVLYARRAYKLALMSSLMGGEGRQNAKRHKWCYNSRKDSSVTAKKEGKSGLRAPKD
jgi:hypothetical protein